MTYRIRVTVPHDGGPVTISRRDAALLCLGDGDELVVERVVHTPCAGDPPAPEHDVTQIAEPHTAVEQRRAPPGPDTEHEATKRAFRSLTR